MAKSATLTERPLDAPVVEAMRHCANDALAVLKLPPASGARQVVEAIDAAVLAWQKGKPPAKPRLSAEDAPLVLGSLWGDQFVRRFKWQWGLITFHENGDAIAPAVLSPDRAVAVYPVHFLMGCLRNPRVDAAILLAFNILEAGGTSDVKPNGYLNLMTGITRIVPR